MFTNINEFNEIVKNIRNVGQLRTEQLIEISRKLFEVILFCDCKIDNSYDQIVHKCDRFNHHDYTHSPTCKCCQQSMLLYYLGRCMEKLADDNRLRQFDDAHFTNAKIRDRSYGHIKIGSELIFSIIRHLNAWRDETRMARPIQMWSFDFKDLSLKELYYDTTSMEIGISIRKLMQPISEWKGTTTEFLVELMKVAETLMIDTKTTWPRSSRKLNQVLQELHKYLEAYGIVIEKQRYVKINRIS